MHDNDRAAISKGILSKNVILAGARVLWKGAANRNFRCADLRRCFLVGLYVRGPGFELGQEVTIWQKIIHGREK